MDEAYKEAAVEVTKGASGLTKVPNYAEVMSKEALAGRLKDAKLQTHHSVPRYLQKMLGITNEAEQDQAPALILDQIDHTGSLDRTGPLNESFHNILNRDLPPNPATPYTRPQILEGLRRAYSEFGRPDVWTLAKQWLQTKGIV